MKNFHKNLNIAFVGGLIGTVIMTILGPKLIGLMLTPPVSFGVNCEPATAYSMQKLILAQIVGLVLGVILTFWVKSKIMSPKENASATK